MKPEAVRTFEVQQLLAEHLCRGFVAETFARRVVVGLQHCIEVAILESCKVSLSRQEAAHASDGVFDGAFLPWCMGIAEEGLDVDVVKLAVVSELGPVVEGDGFAETAGQWFEKSLQGFDGRRSGPVGGVATRMHSWICKVGRPGHLTTA